MSSTRDSSLLRRYSTAVITAGLVVLFATLVPRIDDVISPREGIFWVFAAFVVLGELRPIRVVGHAGELTISTTFILALLITYGTVTAVLVQALASLIADIVARKPLRRGLFNVAQYTLSWVTAGVVYELLAHTHSSFSAVDLPAVFACATVFFLINSVLARTAVALSMAAPVMPHVRKDVLFRAWTTAMLAGLAPAVATVAHLDLALVPLIVLPMAAIHRAAREAARNEHLAHHDSLTGLPNRVLFNDRVSQAMAAARRDGTSVAVMLMDLDRFKEINDTLGHHHGDSLLREVGPRLQSALRASDTVARLGGDEFSILLRATTSSPASVSAVAEKVLDALAAPFVIDGLTLDVGASIGIARFPEDALEVETLMQRADVAMYGAKERHVGYRLYVADEDHNTVGRLAMAADLRHAIEDGELVLHYQPKVEVGTGTVAGVEALVRWERDGEVLQPADFIPLAEKTGLMRPLTTHVLRTALAQVRAWDVAGVALPVAVNLSPRSLLDHSLPLEVARLLAAEDVDGSMLELEITENVIMADPHRAASILSSLNAQGIRLAIDDFGTGYSSLAHLRRLRVDTIKIDRSFVLHMATNTSDELIVRSIVELARNLGLVSVAEGVEDDETYDKLHRMGCDLVQGYHLRHPQPASELTPWLRERIAPVAA